MALSQQNVISELVYLKARCLSRSFIVYTPLLFRIFFGVIILTFNFTLMIDSQKFLSFKGAGRLLDFKLQLEACVIDICQWTAFNELKLNQDKTELLIIHSIYCFCLSLSCLHVGDVEVVPVKAASNLSVVFDDTMSFKLNRILRMFASFPSSPWAKH